MFPYQQPFDRTWINSWRDPDVVGVGGDDRPAEGRQAMDRHLRRVAVIRALEDYDV
jgi:hypothetical protein